MSLLLLRTVIGNLSIGCIVTRTIYMCKYVIGENQNVDKQFDTKRKKIIQPSYPVSAKCAIIFVYLVTMCASSEVTVNIGRCFDVKIYCRSSVCSTILSAMISLGMKRITTTTTQFFAYYMF